MLANNLILKEPWPTNDHVENLNYYNCHVATRSDRYSSLVTNSSRKRAPGLGDDSDEEEEEGEVVNRVDLDTSRRRSKFMRPS